MSDKYEDKTNMKKQPVTLLRYIRHNPENNSDDCSDLNNQSVAIGKSKNIKAKYDASSYAIIWNKLKYEIENSITKEKRVIFDNVNGVAYSGEIVAILGPSGAGKTSLLNVLVNKTKQGQYEGRKYLVSKNGTTIDKLTMAFIPQQDYLNDFMTVEENLKISSEFKNTHHNFDHKSNIEKIARILNLKDCYNTRCSQISGGEYKRTCVAQELVSNPDLLVLDEPTSGLDSCSSKKLLQCIKQLIQNTKTEHRKRAMSVILTIHQPGDELFHLFDRVYIMGHSGKIIYEGPPSNAFNVVRDSISYELLCNSSISKELSTLLAIIDEKAQHSKATSVASLMLEIASNLYGQEVVDLLSGLQIADHCHRLQLLSLHVDKHNNTMEKTVSIRVSSCQNDTNAIDAGMQVNELMIDNKFSRDFYFSVRKLLNREFETLFRDKIQCLAIMLYYISCSIFVWVTFPTMTNSFTSCPIVLKDISIASLLDKSGGISKLIEDRGEELASVMENMKSLSTISVSFALACGSFSIFTVRTRLNVSLKEVANGWYNYSAIYVVVTLFTILRDTLLPTVALLITFKLCGFPTSYMEWRLLTLVGSSVIFIAINSLIGLICGTLFIDSLAAAVLLLLMFYFPQLPMVQFILRPNSMRAWLQYIRWTSLHHSMSGVFALIRYGYDMCPCDSNLEYYMQQDNAVTITMMTANTAGNQLAQNSVNYALSNSNNVTLSQMGNSLNQFVNYGELIRDCNQFEAYILTYTGVKEDQLYYFITVIVIYFVSTLVLIFAAMSNLYKRRA